MEIRTNVADWPTERIRPDLHAELRARADGNKRSPRAELELLLEKALDGEGK